ncbi:MAG: Rrf2 family transcriptional regulator [Burkholderiales bacterium]
MRLTTMTDFALRLLMYVARQPDRLCTIAEVAQVYDISEAHLMKVTHQLGLLGFIETVRGKGGGLRLACAPADIPLGDVVRGMEADFRLAECFGEDGRCVLTGNCRLQVALHGALDAFMRHLDQFSLADIVPPEGAFDSPRVVRLAPMRWVKSTTA